MIAVLALLFAPGAEAACTVIRDATLHLPDGPVQGQLVLVDQRIAAAGEVALTGRGTTFQGQVCTVVDGTGKHVTAGLIEAQSQLGVVEVGLESATRDADAGGDDPVRAAMRVTDAYNPRSSLIPIQRIDGVTGALVVPTGGRVSKNWLI